MERTRGSRDERKSVAVKQVVPAVRGRGVILQKKMAGRGLIVRVEQSGALDGWMNE